MKKSKMSISQSTFSSPKHFDDWLSGASHQFEIICDCYKVKPLAHPLAKYLFNKYCLSCVTKCFFSFLMRGHFPWHLEVNLQRFHGRLSTESSQINIHHASYWHKCLISQRMHRVCKWESMQGRSKKALQFKKKKKRMSHTRLTLHTVDLHFSLVSFVVKAPLCHFLLGFAFALGWFVFFKFFILFYIYYLGLYSRF